MTTGVTASKVRAYPLNQHANEGKLALVRELLVPWRSALGGMQQQLTRAMLNGAPLAKRMSTKTEDLEFGTELSARQVKSVYNQTFAALESWQKLLQASVRELITGSTLDNETKTILYRVNKRSGWYNKTLSLPVLVNKTTGEVKHGESKPGKGWTKDELEVPPELLKLLRHMLKRARSTSTPAPDLSRVNTLLLDGTIAQVERASEGSSFDYWVRVSTMTSGKPVWIPLRAHKYFTEAPGEVSNFVQLNYRNNGDLQFVLVKKSVPAPARVTGEYLGLDWGMRALFATSDGRLLGQGALPHLRELDEQSQALQKALQAQGISRKTNKRYKAFQRRMREYIKNEVNRVLNALAREDIIGLVVEKLDFRGGGMSRAMNRLLTRFGRAAVKNKLKDLTDDTGLDVIEVNAAYSSQECSGCSFVHKANRSGTEFLCRFCGKKTHADIDSARVLVKRRSLGVNKDSGTLLLRGNLRQRLDGEFQRRWHCSPPSLGASGNHKAGTRRRSAVRLSRSL